MRNYTTDNANHSVGDELKHFLNGSTYNKLSEKDRGLCDTLLNPVELGAALKLLKIIHLQGQMESHQAFKKCFGNSLNFLYLNHCKTQ